jgi:glycine oxidase
VHSCDVVIAGAGIIGLSVAIELRRAGASVAVLDRGEPGREASSAAAGMLVADDPETDPKLKPLARMSAAMYPAFVEELELRSGIKVGLEDRGTLYAAHSDDQLPGSPLSNAELRSLEPELVDLSLVCFLEEQTVDPRLLVEAALVAAKRTGVAVHHEAKVEGVKIATTRDLEVRTTAGPYSAVTFVNCAGAWAAEIMGCAFPSRPVKGQMLTVIPPDFKLRHVVRSREVYLLPRSNGRILIGATVEEAGFDKTVQPETIQRLHKVASKLVPWIGQSKILEAWAGLRPGSPDGLPIIGAGSLPGTYVATGHFRNGILLAPLTAALMSDLIQGRKNRLDLQPFSPSRFVGNRASAV